MSGIGGSFGLHTWIGKIGIQTHFDKITFSSEDDSLTLNGIKVNPISLSTPSSHRHTTTSTTRIQLSGGGYLKRGVGFVEIKLPSYWMHFRIHRRGRNGRLHIHQQIERSVHLNMFGDGGSTSTSVSSSASKPHGLLGQTANFIHPVHGRDRQGGGVIEGKVNDYEIKEGNLFGVDFKFIQFIK